MRNGVYKLN